MGLSLIDELLTHSLTHSKKSHEPEYFNGVISLPRAHSPNSNGDRKNIGENTFDDLLGTQGFANFGKKDQGPKTMAEMKRVELAKELDPVKLAVSCFLLLDSRW